MGICKNCGEMVFDYDSTHGNTACTTCGAVYEKEVLVSQVEFTVDKGGKKNTATKFVSNDSPGGPPMTGPFHHKTLLPNETPIWRARSRASLLCSKLRLGPRCLDVAVNFYKLLCREGKTKGRSNLLTVGACVYLSARLEGSSLTFLDFCDAMDNTDIYRFGREFAAVSSALCIHPPGADLAMYVLRFASSLDLGGKTQAVVMSAVRLLQRMKRDSIQSGRKPSGLCGAALLVASRLHGFKRSVKDIVKVVRVHQTTLRKRLLEFGETPSSRLSIEEFMKVDLTKEEDPPCYTSADCDDSMLVASDEVITDVAALKVQIEKELGKGWNLDGIKNKVWASAIGAADLLIGSNEGDESDQIAIGGLPPTMQSLGCEPREKTDERDDYPQDEEDEEDNGDSDIEQYILNNEEAEIKKREWYAIHGNYLKKQEEEKLRRESEEKNRGRKRNTVKRKMTEDGVGPDKKKKSLKIDYDVLKELEKSFSAMKKVKKGSRNKKKPSSTVTAEECASSMIDGSNLAIIKEEPEGEEMNNKKKESGEFVLPVIKLEIDENLQQEIDVEVELQVEEEEEQESVINLLKGHNQGDNDSSK